MSIKIIIKDLDTGIELFKGCNKTLESGSALIATNHFNIKPNISTPSYNRKLINLEKSRFEKTYDRIEEE